MSDLVTMTEVESMVLEHLRPIRRAVDDLREDMVEVKSRLGIPENQYASVSSRLDRVDQRVGRIGQRLELAEA